MQSPLPAAHKMRVLEGGQGTKGQSLLHGAACHNNLARVGAGQKQTDEWPAIHVFPYVDFLRTHNFGSLAEPCSCNYLYTSADMNRSINVGYCLGVILDFKDLQSPAPAIDLHDLRFNEIMKYKTMCCSYFSSKHLAEPLACVSERSGRRL